MIEKIREDIVTLEDGFKYYWPESGTGALSSSHLRLIADELDRLNKEWEDKIKDYFSSDKIVV
jgi:hypothetical protein